MEKTRVIFEGTEEQISNLFVLIHWSDNDLPENKTHQYQLSNLWSIEDVNLKYKCTDEQAMQVLEKALSNPHVIETIFDTIESEANEVGLIELNEEV